MAKKQTTKKVARRTKDARKAATPAASRRERTRDPRLPAPGSVLARTFKGREVRVTVLDAGFRFEGKEWRSLTAIARSLTGYPVSGPHFFGIDAPRAAAQPATETAAASA
jgi:hypothetical protein